MVVDPGPRRGAVARIAAAAYPAVLGAVSGLIAVGLLPGAVGQCLRAAGLLLGLSA